MYYFFLEKESSEPYDWHKQIWRYFEKYEDRRFTFCAGGNELLIISERPPEGIAASKIILPSLCNIVTVSCPVVRRSATKKLEPIIDADDLRLWLSKVMSGFSLKDINAEVLKPVRFVKNGHIGIAHRVAFSAKATVDDIRQATRTIERGIGKHKFVGLGAIMIPEVMI